MGKLKWLSFLFVVSGLLFFNINSLEVHAE
ncbi:hypothetical protein J2S08_004026 [Bacillus chungangensis]|uniref:Phosphatase n=1 Tax=Bacillus chungangensis TaxID=587633 RepID=A0ABT9WXV6_9BACI|nr:hypothetical protein [Bacillus chungangensis]